MESASKKDKTFRLWSYQTYWNIIDKHSTRGDRHGNTRCFDRHSSTGNYVEIETQDALTDTQTQETNVEIRDDLPQNTLETYDTNVNDDHELDDEDEEYSSDDDYINENDDLEKDDLLPENFT